MRINNTIANFNKTSQHWIIARTWNIYNHFGTD